MKLYQKFKFLPQSAYIIVMIIVAISFSCRASDNDSVRYLGEVRATFSGGKNTPFWLVSNLQGLGSPEKN